MAHQQNEKHLKFRQDILLERRAELDSRLHKIESELDAEHSKDSDEFANEIEDNDVLEGIGQAGLLEIAMIDAALERIKIGQYGICVSCGDEISAARLDVLPFTPVCKTCAAKQDAH